MLKFLQRKKTDPKKELKKVLGNFELPTFPVIAQQVMERVRDPNASSSEIANLIEKDPGISVGVLKTVNSAVFSPRRPVDNLNQAVAMMGLAPLESLVLSTSVGKVLPKSSTPFHSTAEFWRASARRAAVARAIASELHPASVQLSYTAALLQDMAITFLVRHKGDAYGGILERWHEGAEDLADLEQKTFGWDHAEVAVWICNEWGFSESLGAAIGGHHGAEIDGFKVPPAVRLVSCIREDQENPGTDLLLENAESKYGMDPKHLTDLVERGFEAAEDLARLFAA